LQRSSQEFVNLEMILWTSCAAGQVEAADISGAADIGDDRDPR
jgi:hypothetical protein